MKRRAEWIALLFSETRYPKTPNFSMDSIGCLSLVSKPLFYQNQVHTQNLCLMLGAPLGLHPKVQPFVFRMLYSELFYFGFFFLQNQSHTVLKLAFLSKHEVLMFSPLHWHRHLPFLKTGLSNSVIFHHHQRLAKTTLAQHIGGRHHLGINPFPSRRSIGSLCHSSYGRDNF